LERTPAVRANFRLSFSNQLLKAFLAAITKRTGTRKHVVTICADPTLAFSF
jgi:hypothetical protein